MDVLKNMKETLIASVQGQMTNLAQADCQELGAAIDMIKDLAEAMYYCKITEAMEEKTNSGTYYYNEYHYPEYERDMDKDSGRMYYTEKPYMKDNHQNEKEGRSYINRRSYMEAKELHKPVNVQMKELDSYAQELTKDITDMIKDATMEEKQVLKTKLISLANTIV